MVMVEVKNDTVAGGGTVDGQTEMITGDGQAGRVNDVS